MTTTSKQITIENLSGIKTSKDLQRQIYRLKANIRFQEIEMKERLHQLPEEAVKYAAVHILPAFLISGVAARSWGILRNLFGLITSIKFSGKGSFKHSLIESIKKVGFAAAFKAAFNLYKNRKH